MQSSRAVAERLYRVRTPGGQHVGPSTPEEVCTLIASGVIDLDAVAQHDGDPSFAPITQFPRFAKAFEARFGIGGRPAGSDSTPHSGADRTPLSPSPAIEDRTLRITASLATNDLPPVDPQSFPPPETLPGPKDSLGFRQQELDAWTPISTRTIPAQEAPNFSDIEPHTPVTQSSVSSVEGRVNTKTVEVPIILGQLTDDLTSDAPGEPPDDGKTTPSFDLPAAMLGDETPQAVPLIHDLLPQRRAISEIVRALPPKLEPLAISQPAPTVSRSFGQLYYALAGWAVLFLVFFGSGIALDMGSEESRWIPTGYYWARVLLLISAGMGLSTLLLKDDFVGASRFHFSPKWCGAALILGVLAGLASPGQKIGAGAPVALAMGFLQVVSEEIFFRGYVDRALMKSLHGIAVPTAIAAVMYGCFQLTYGTLWLDRSLPEVLFYAFLGILIAGVPLSFLHHKTHSFVAPFIFHVALMSVMLAGAS